MGPAVAGALIGAGSSIVSGAITGASNIGAAKMNFRQALQMSREQQNYNSREASYARDWQEKMWNKQNEYSEDVYNRFSSPSAVKRQMLEAGLNPALVMDNGSVGSVATNSPASAPAASASLPTTPQIPYMGYDMLTNGFVNVAQALKAIGEAKKVGVETSRMEQFMSDELKKLKLSNNAQELANSMNAVKFKYLDEKERALVDKALQDLSLGDLKSEEIQRNIDILVEKHLIAKFEREHWIERFNADLANTNMDTDLKGAQANAANASAAVKWDEHSMRDLKSELLRQSANNQYSQSRLNYASERVAEITGDMNELLREAQEFKGERSKANPAWRRLSAYGRSLVESWVSNAQILGIKGLGDARNLAENPFNADGHLGSAYKVLLNLQAIINGNSEASYNDARDIHNKYD